MKWQGDPAGGPAKIPGGRLLWRFKIGGPSREDVEARIVNELLIEATVASASRDYQRATEEQPPAAPVIIEHPIDPEIQTGDSRGLGGAMEISMHPTDMKKPPAGSGG